MHSFEPRAGDCVFIPAGTVHAIGGGLVVAEIQESSDVTYRLYDWNRTGPDGKPRPLHIEAGLEAVTRFEPVAPLRRPEGWHGDTRPLVRCEYFVFEEVRPQQTWSVGGDDGWHFLAVLEGEVQFDPAWGLPPLHKGNTVLLPAAIGRQSLTARPIAAAPAALLHVALP